LISQGEGDGNRQQAPFPRKENEGRWSSLKLQRWRGKENISGRILGGIGEEDLRRFCNESSTKNWSFFEFLNSP
jgi:hypothetical protein